MVREGSTDKRVEFGGEAKGKLRLWGEWIAWVECVLGDPDHT